MIKAKAKKNGQKSESQEDREDEKRAQTRRLVLAQKTQISLI